MFKPEAEGRVWKFGDDISTDSIKPGFARGETLREQAMFCMQAIRPEFAREVRPGDIIVAGRNFGCGSSRPAAQNFMTLGISCVIAESFARLFFRSSVNLGFPLLYCRGIFDACQEGEIVRANFQTGEVRNLNSGRVLKADALPDIAMKLIEEGGVVAIMKKEYGGRKGE